MKRIRVIPVLLLQKGGLVKTVRFKKPIYIGDPINAVRIFNEKEIDEIVILDIDATREGRGPTMQAIKELSGEAFIPLAYGGGISSIEQVKELFYLGVEKVILNYQSFKNPSLLTQIASLVGSQSVVASIDVKKNIFGKYKVYVRNGEENTQENPIDYAKKMESAGAGEIFLNVIDRDGTYAGYDLELVKQVSQSVNIPIVICGGASTVNDFALAVQNGASATAAGSMFVLQRPHQAVLISYPSQELLEKVVYSVR